MGFIRKTVKKIGRGIKKIGKKIGKAFKSILKPFSKAFGKLGFIGSMAMMMIMPGIGQMLSGFGANLGGVVGKAVSFVGNAVNYVASAPKKIFGSITDAMGKGFDYLMGETPTGDSWFTNFKKEFGTFDVSKQGQADIASFKKDFGDMKTDIKEIISPTDDGKIALTESDVNTMIKDGRLVDADLDKLQKGTMEGFKLAPEDKGMFGNIRRGAGELKTKISDVKVPGVGTVGDVAWGTNAGISAYNAYATIAGPDVSEVGGSGDFSYQASDLLGPTTDQGGIYNMTAPTWSYDYNQSYMNNMTNAQNVWNNHYGFGQGFDPSATPGYGFGYEQWLYDSMGVRQ